MSQNQLNLKVGGGVVVPPPGEKAIFTDSDGTLKQVDSAGAESELGGSAAPTSINRFASLVADAMGSDDFLIRTVNLDNSYETEAFVDSSAGGSPNAFTPKNQDGGGYSVTSPDANDKYFRRIVGAGVAGTKFRNFANPQANPWAIRVNCAIDTGSSGNGRQWMAAISNTETGPHDGTAKTVGLLYIPVNDLAYIAIDYPGNIDLVALAWTPDALFHVWDIWFDGTTIRAAMDGTAFAQTQTVLTNVPNGASYLTWGQLNIGDASINRFQMFWAGQIHYAARKSSHSVV